MEFFATSHSKGPLDAIGGTVNRLVNNNIIERVAMLMMQNLLLIALSNITQKSNHVTYYQTRSTLVLLKRYANNF